VQLCASAKLKTAFDADGAAVASCAARHLEFSPNGGDVWTSFDLCDGLDLAVAWLASV